MSPVEYISAAIAFGSVLVSLTVIFMMRFGKEKGSKRIVEVSKLETGGPLPLKTKRSTTYNEVEEAKNRLRIFGVEREILSYAIRRLYEAQAEGKISEEERDRMAQGYKEEMKRINEDISRGESLLALDELERMQGDLLKLFNERFEELNKRIEELRVRSGIGQVEAVEGGEEEEKPSLAETPEAPTAAEERVRKETSKKKPAPPAKSEAERKVEQIMAEVEKVLARLEQMEVSE